MPGLEERVNKLERILYSVKGGATVLIAALLLYFGVNHVILLPTKIDKQIDKYIKDVTDINIQEYAKEISEYRKNAENDASKLSNLASKYSPENTHVQTGEMQLTKDDMDAITEGNKGIWMKRIKFDKPFSSKPEVFVALRHLDIYHDNTDKESANTRIYVKVLSVDNDGFNYRFVTWRDTRVYRVIASWVAIGNKKIITD